MTDNDAIPMIELKKMLFPLDMLSGDLRNRWDRAQADYEAATTDAQRVTVHKEIETLTAEATVELSPHIAMRILQSVPKRSICDLGCG
jgi:hypothetical protein